MESEKIDIFDLNQYYKPNNNTNDSLITFLDNLIYMSDIDSYIKDKTLWIVKKCIIALLEKRLDLHDCFNTPVNTTTIGKMIIFISFVLAVKFWEMHPISLNSFTYTKSSIKHVKIAEIKILKAIEYKIWDCKKV